ncbi:BspA family leucine-rich repeat surface protein [Acetilactobacillus jinshanensis]|uniref:BspA family leucine-rich repeat surface protein n=1 Tax=Acetilactobacillus jinshanensis TaxID=1720083 RepID=A0A4P6ZKJ4_9LACO|nr:BspA family leucine-rich repeat surface protein [Acetilactobacillus jinshanensis]QBP18204.1 BspA family leucine-rich repeat surface protein [Acetilactobacillus jinshanensis]URL61074.1 BspA family leucine-rich repeat surface protein [uncultured bacterium]
MGYNKRQYRKTNDKKVLHKIRKRWVVVSLALLATLGGASVAHKGKIAHAQTNPNNTSANAQQNPQSTSGDVMSDASHMHAHLVSAAQTNVAQNNLNESINNNTSNSSFKQITSNANSVVNSALQAKTTQSNDGESTNNLRDNRESSGDGFKSQISGANQVAHHALMKLGVMKLGSTNNTNTNSDYTAPSTDTDFDDIYYDWDGSTLRFDKGQWNSSQLQNSDPNLTNGQRFMYDILNNIKDNHRSTYSRPGDVQKVVTEVDFGPHFHTSDLSDMHRMFEGYSDLQKVTGLNTSDASDMSHMFENDPSITTTNDLSTWDTSHVTNMSYMFDNDKNLSDLSGLSDWNTSNVQFTNNMFSNDSSLTNVTPIGNWGMHNVTNMSLMFYKDTALTNISGLSNWDTSSVLWMPQMFRSDFKLSNIKALTNWDTSKVRNFAFMFKNDPHLFDSDLNDSDINNSDALFTFKALSKDWNLNGLLTNTNVSHVAPNGASSTDTGNAYVFQNDSDFFDYLAKHCDAFPSANYTVRKLSNGEIKSNPVMTFTIPGANWTIDYVSAKPDTRSTKHGVSQYNPNNSDYYYQSDGGNTYYKPWVLNGYTEHPGDISLNTNKDKRRGNFYVTNKNATAKTSKVAPAKFYYYFGNKELNLGKPGERWGVLYSNKNKTYGLYGTSYTKNGQTYTTGMSDEYGPIGQSSDYKSINDKIDEFPVEVGYHPEGIPNGYKPFFKSSDRVAYGGAINLEILPDGWSIKPSDIILQYVDKNNGNNITPETPPVSDQSDIGNSNDRFYHIHRSYNNIEHDVKTDFNRIPKGYHYVSATDNTEEIDTEKAPTIINGKRVPQTVVIYVAPNTSNVIYTYNGQTKGKDPQTFDQTKPSDQNVTKKNAQDVPAGYHLASDSTPVNYTPDKTGTATTNVPVAPDSETVQYTVNGKPVPGSTPQKYSYDPNNPKQTTFDVPSDTVPQGYHVAPGQKTQGLTFNNDKQPQPIAVLPNIQPSSSAQPSSGQSSDSKRTQNTTASHPIAPYTTNSVAAHTTSGAPASHRYSKGKSINKNGGITHYTTQSITNVTIPNDVPSLINFLKNGNATPKQMHQAKKRLMRLLGLNGINGVNNVNGNDHYGHYGRHGYPQYAGTGMSAGQYHKLYGNRYGYHQYGSRYGQMNVAGINHMRSMSASEVHAYFGGINDARLGHAMQSNDRYYVQGYHDFEQAEKGYRNVAQTNQSNHKNAQTNNANNGNKLPQTGEAHEHMSLAAAVLLALGLAFMIPTLKRQKDNK